MARGYRPNNLGHAADVENPGCERRCDRRFSFGKGNSDICRLECATVIRAITTEAARITDTLKLLDKLVLFIRRHPSVYSAFHEELLIVILVTSKQTARYWKSTYAL